MGTEQEFDHINLRSKGGLNSHSNAQASLRIENIMKSDR